MFATCAARDHDWAGFFTAAAECARAMNRRESVVDAALLANFLGAEKIHVPAA